MLRQSGFMDLSAISSLKTQFFAGILKGFVICRSCKRIVHSCLFLLLFEKDCEICFIKQNYQICFTKEKKRRPNNHWYFISPVLSFLMRLK